MSDEGWYRYSITDLLNNEFRTIKFIDGSVGHSLTIYEYPKLNQQCKGEIRKGLDSINGLVQAMGI